MTCTLSPITSKFNMPRTTIYSGSTQTYLDQVSLDYILGIADAVYNHFGYKTKIDNANYVAQLISDLASSQGIKFCVTDTATMKLRREFLAEEYVMKAMEGKLTAFDNMFMNILSEEKFNSFDTFNKLTKLKPYIGAFPKVYKETKERSYFNEVLSQISSKSEYFGEQKKRYNFKLKLISKRYISDKGTWVINALQDEKDLITFFDSKTEVVNVEVGDMFKVRGTVTKHEFSKFTKCKETRLSRIIFS